MMKLDKFLEMINKALNSNTVYCSGGFGFPITEEIIKSKTNQFSYSITKQNQLKQLIGKNYFGFDCVNLIKAVLWGWNGDSSKTYGGSVYKSNGVPDVNDSGLFKLCKETSTDFSKIVKGAIVWMDGHVGVYIGNGQVIEATAKWTGNVLVSSLGNLGYSSDKTRVWAKWGKLPYVDYNTTATSINNNSTKVLAGEGYWQIVTRCFPNRNKDYANLTAETQKLNGNKPLHVGDIVKLPSGAKVSTTVNTKTPNPTTSSTLVVAYNTFIKDLKSSVGLSQSATLEQLFNKLPKLYNNNAYSKVALVLQTYLNVLGFDCGKANGYFGNNTEKAVKLYQQKYTGIADGVLGVKGRMWKHLLGIK